MKPMISNMFRSYKTLDVVTLFHKPSFQASMRVANILKQVSSQSQAHATEDQASDHTHQHTRREPFQLEIVETPPTQDQLKTLLGYLGDTDLTKLVSGATNKSEAVNKLNENTESLIRPVVRTRSSRFLLIDFLRILY